MNVNTHYCYRIKINEHSEQLPENCNLHDHGMLPNHNNACSFLPSDASHRKRGQKTATLPPSHRHPPSDTENKQFRSSPRKQQHPRKKKQSPSVVPSSCQLKRRHKAVSQPADSLSSLSQEEAEYSQSVSMNLTELLDDEKLWDEK